MEWKTIKGFSNYEISEFGDVRRLVDSPTGRPAGSVLKPCLNGNGYLVVNLHKEGRGKTKDIHLLVLENFVGPKPSPNLQCAHNDGNCLNNHFSNLRWATAAENTLDKFRHGTVRAAPGSKNANAKITEEQALEIRNSKDRIKNLAARFSLGPQQICRIRSGQMWKHILPENAQ